MNPRRLCTLAIIMMFFCTVFLTTCPFSKSSSYFDYVMQIQHETITLIPGENETLSLFVNQSGTLTGGVSLQGIFVGPTPKELSVDIHPMSGTTPFISNIMVHSSMNANPGLFIYQINASSAGANHSLYLRINVTTNVDVNLHTDKDRYLNGQTIHMFGNAITTYGSPLTSGSVLFTITTNLRNISLVTHLQNSSYEYFYPISYGDDEGQWAIQAHVVGNASQVGIQTTHIAVSLPLEVMRYAVDLYSPPNSATYRRGDSFSISVYVTENTHGVKNATTSCRLPSMETISLLEYSPGNYKQNYTIPWDAPLGESFFTVDSTKNVSGALKAGGSALSITIQPALLQLTVVKPVSLQLLAPSSISLEVQVQYPDNTIMKTGDVIAVMPRGNVTLEKKNTGLYTANISFTNQDAGTQVMELHARDSFGNAGTMKKIVVIIPVSHPSVFVSFIPFLAACACCIIGVVSIRRFYRGQHLRSIQEELKATRQLKEETGKKYYVEGSISKEIYEALMYEHVQRYSQLQKEERKILNK